MMKNRRFQRLQRPRFSGMTLTRMLPNMITVAATCAGLTGVRFAMDGRWEFAVGAIVIAAILDALDGRMARMLNASSDFGAQLDSLSDFVAFGVSPAFILYFWSTHALGGAGWVAALFYAVCCGLRLARFNSRIDGLPAYAYNYFQGVPAPAGAGLCLLPLIMSLEIPAIASVHAAVIAVWMVVVALLMVSELPTFSFKKIKLPPGWVLPFMAVIGLAAAGLAGAPWITLSVILFAYIATLPVAWQRFRHLQLQAEKLQQNEDSATAETTNS